YRQPSHLPSFSTLIPPPPRPTLFPYTTLFRSPAARTPRTRSIRDSCTGGASTTSTAITGKCCGWIRTRSNDEGDHDGKNRVRIRSEEHTSELQSRSDLVCRLLLEKKKKKQK